MKNLLLFEWKLFARNKRLKQILVLIPIFIPLVYVQFLSLHFGDGNITFNASVWIMIMLIMAVQMAVYAFSTNALFIEKQLTMPFSVFKIFQAKYYFFFLLSSTAFVAMLPAVFLGVSILELIAMYLYVNGLMLAGLFYVNLFSYKAFDIKSSSSFNYQGFTWGNQIAYLVVFIVCAGLIVLGYLFVSETITQIFMIITGTFFIAVHKKWLEFIAKKIEEKKYYRIERFREK